MLTGAVAILITVSQANKSSNDSSGRSVLHHTSASRRTSHHAEKQSATRAHAKDQFLDRIIQRPELPFLSGSHDISILYKETLDGDIPLKKAHNINFPMEKVETNENNLSSTTDHTKLLRSARDTSAMTKDMTRFNQQPAPYNLSHLSEQCLYADICNKQGREPPSKSLDSCCLPCSCESTCGKIGNCCDQRENNDYMCHSPVLKQSESNEDFGYFMVDKCLNEPDRDCTEMNAGLWGSLYPVYDPVLNMNFYNPQCAECSGVKDYTRWGISIVCGRFDVNNEYILNALRGQVSEEYKLKFTPPKAMDILKHVCSNKLINAVIQLAHGNYIMLNWKRLALAGTRQW